MNVRRLITFVALTLSCAPAASAQALPRGVPSRLSALVSAARLDRPVAGWCDGEFRAGHPGAYAVAISSASGGGRYLVLEPGAAAVELAAFTGKPDISCYTPAEARKRDVAIRSSDTIHGRLAPQWATTVVCAFVENTRAVCWQYSPGSGMFVTVGEWVT